jgi:AAA family ATP:ADP antiporter
MEGNMAETGPNNLSQPREGSHGFLYKALKLFSDVRPGEALTLLLLTLNAYLLFLAYYILKPLRDALMLESWGAAEKNYMSAGMAVLLVFVVKLYSAVASRFPRHKMITWVTMFFISNLVLFFLLIIGGVGPGLFSIIFLIWAGIFNLVIVAQFWGFANDLYTEDQGKRLFPLIAFGATFGAFSGGQITEWLAMIGENYLMLVSAAFLGLCIMMTWIIHLRDKRQIKPQEHMSPEKASDAEAEKPLEKGGAFKLVFKKRYLLYIALFVLILNFVNTNGVYLLDSVADNAAATAVETGTAGGMDSGEYLTAFYANFYKIQNLFAMFVQLFLVSRIFKWFGVRAAIFFLPVLALGGYVFVSFGAVLLLVKWVKWLENGLDYSLMNTTRHSLFLITSREEKYKAQAVTKTFFHRSGDVLSAALVFLGTTFLAFQLESFAMVNVALAFIWIVLGVLIAKEHKRLTAQAAQS